MISGVLNQRGASGSAYRCDERGKLTMVQVMPWLLEREYQQHRNLDYEGLPETFAAWREAASPCVRPKRMVVSPARRGLPSNMSLVSCTSTL